MVLNTIRSLFHKVFTKSGFKELSGKEFVKLLHGQELKITEAHTEMLKEIGYSEQALEELMSEETVDKAAEKIGLEYEKILTKKELYEIYSTFQNSAVKKYSSNIGFLVSVRTVVCAEIIQEVLTQYKPRNQHKVNYGGYILNELGTNIYLLI